MDVPTPAKQGRSFHLPFPVVVEGTFAKIAGGWIVVDGKRDCGSLNTAILSASVEAGVERLQQLHFTEMAGALPA